MTEETAKLQRVVVTGGRGFRDGARIEADLRALLPLGLCRVAEGACPYGGADALAYDAWHLLRNEPTQRYPITGSGTAGTATECRVRRSDPAATLDRSSPPLASTHRLSRRWHGERPPTMRTTPALLLLAACCGPIPPTDPSASSGGDLVTSSTGSDSMGVSSEIGSASAPPDDATSAKSSSDTSAGSTSTGQVTTSASSGGDSSTSGATTGGEGGSSSGGSEPCGRCADGRVCAEHPDTGVPWCVAPCGPSLVCPTVGGLEFECLDGLCFPVL